METPESTIPRASKRRCLRRDKEPIVCTPQNETSPSSFFPGSFLSPATRNAASHRSSSTARTSLSNAECGRGVERSVATPKTTTSPYKGAFPSAPRHVPDDADMAKQQFALMQSLRDASQGSRSLANVLQEATDLALQTGDGQAELVALAQNALKVMKNVNSGRNEKTPAEGTHSSFSQASPSLHHDRLVDFLRQRHALSAGCESRQGASLYPANDEERPQESPYREGQITEGGDFLRLRGEDSQQGSWAPTAQGISHYDTTPKARHPDDTKNPAQPVETNSQLPSNPRDVLHLRTAFQSARSCKSPSPDRGSLRPHCVAGGNDNSAPSAAFQSVGGAPHHRAEPTLASFAPLLCSSPEALPTGLRVDASSRPVPSTSSPDVILQTLRTLISLTTPSAAPVVPCSFPVSTGPSERDLSAASAESLSALLRSSNAPTAATSAAGICATARPDPCELQRGESPSTGFGGGVQPAAQNLLYTLLMSCGTGQQRQTYAEREGACTGPSSARIAGRDTRQYSALPNQPGNHPSHSRMLSTTQSLMSTPSHVRSSPSGARLGDFGNSSSSSAECRSGSCVSGQGYGQPQHEEVSKDMKALGRVGINCSISGLLAKKSHSMDTCRSASEDNAQTTPTHSSYNSLRRRGSLLIGADKEASPGGPRGSAGDGAGVSRGRNRTESLTRSDGTTKLESLTRSESTSRTGTAGRARGRYAATAAAGEALAPGSVGRGVGATAAGGAGGCNPENETGKPDVTLGGNRPHYHVAKQEWRVRYYLNGKRKMRTYSAKFYGYEAAHSMATDFAQYVDKNEALPHPVCKPVGLGGGRGAAALSAVMASRALSAAAAARERSEHPGTPVAARYATTRHDSLTEQHPRPPHPWESSPAAAAAKSLEALRLACSAGAKATNCPPQQMHAAAAAAGAAAARATGGGADTFSVDGEATPILTRLSGLNRSSTLHFQASATPSDEEHSPYYEHSMSSNVEPDRESGSSQSHEAHEESALQQKYSSMHEQQTTTPTSLPAVDFASEMTLAHFLKSRKRRSPSACCVGGPSAPTSPAAAGVPPAVAGGVEDKSDRPLGGVLTRGSCTPSAANVVTQSTTEREEEAKPAVIQNSTVDCNAGVDMFFQGLQDREKVYLSKLFSSVWVPSADPHHPADVALVRDGDGSTRSVRSNSGSVAPAAPGPNGVPAATATSQAKCALMLQKQETRCSLLQTHTPSTASYPENSSTSSLSVSRSNSYRTFAEAAATPHKASTCSLADEPLQRHAGKFSPSSAGLSGELIGDEMGVWMREDSSESSRDIPGLTAGQTDFTGGGGRDGARAGAAASAPVATAAEVAAPAVLATTQTPTGVGNPVENGSENIAGLAPGHATAAMLAKTAMSQQMLDTVMLFDEFIRGFEKEFSAEQLQQERRAILAPAASLASEVSACLPSLASPLLANGGSRKPSRSCDPASTLSSSLCRPTKEDAGDVVSRSLSYSSVATDTKDAAWLSREGSRAEEIPKQLETLLQTGTSLSTLPALSHASAGTSVTRGVSRVVTGLRMHLGSSELLVLSRVLVELTSSTYVLVTTLRATLASSTDIVQKHCEDLPRNAAETTHTHSNELSKEARLQQEAGEAESSTIKSGDQEGWTELQQKGPGIAPAATREHNSEVALQQQEEEERKQQQQEGIGSAEGSAKSSVASCNVAACGGGGTLNFGSSWERSGSVQAAKVERALPAGTSRVERKSERDTTVFKVLRARFNTEAGPAAEVTPSKTVAAEAALGSGEDTEKGQTSRNELTVEPAREETRPNRSSSFFSGPGGPADVCKQSPLQAARKMGGAEEHLRSSAEPSSSTVEDMSYGASAEKQAVEILTGTERACEDLSAEQQHEIGCQRSLKVARGDCTAAEKEPRMFVSSSLQQKAASGRQQSPEEKGEEYEEQETKEKIARGPAGTAPAAAKQHHPRQSFAAGEGATGEGESSTIQQTAQERELRQKTIRSQRLLPQGETDLYVQQRLLVQEQQQPPIRADNFSGSSATKDVVRCSCTDSAAVLQSIVTLLQSQQRLVSVIRQLQGSLPQYLRLIIRVAGHCFLPFKLPPATYFIKKPGRTATESASDDSAAGSAASGKPAQALNAAPPRVATKAREHQHSEQPPPKSHRGCSLDQGETMLRHSSGSLACAGKKASESRGVSFEAEEVQAQKKEKMTSELQQHDKVKFCAELPERLSSFAFLSRQSSVAGFPVYGAATSASSTEVEYSCSESPGPPGVDAERKLSRDTAEDETTVLSCTYQEASHCGAGRTETTGKKQWDVSDGGSAVPFKAEARRHYTPDEAGEASETAGGAERTATSVGGASAVTGRTSAVVPYVEVPGGRVIQDEAELEVFLLRPFQPAVCNCQDRPCPCDRQHIADLIHMLYTLPRSCEDADTAAPSSMPAASDDAYSPPHAATAGAADPLVSRAAPSGGGVASAVLSSRTAEAASPHADEQKDWHVCGRTAQIFTSAPAGASLQEVSGSGSDLSDPAAPHLQQRVSLSSAPAADLSAVQEGRPTRSSSGNARFKSSHSGITSSRTTSSGSSSSSSEPSVIGSDALMLVEESLRQVLFAEKLAEGNSGSASSTRALPSASASPLCGSQTTATPTTLLSAADTPGSASSCAGSPFQRGLSATAAPASSLLREAACQPTVPAAVEEKRGATGREGKATAGAATTTVKEEEETDVGAGHRRRKPTGFSSTSLTAVSPAAATLITCSGPSAIPRKVSGNSVAKKDVASCSPICPLTRESDCLHGTTTGAGEQVSLTAAVSSVSGAEEVKEGVTIPGRDLSRSAATGGAVETWQGVSSPDIGESKDFLDKAHVGTAETRVRGAATVHATAAPKQNTMADATGAAENVEGDEGAMKTHRFEEAPLRKTSGDAASASGENAFALGSAPATGAKGSVAAGISPAAEATEERPCSVTASESMGSGEEERQVAQTEPTIAAGAVTRETAPAAASRQTSSGLASVAPAAAVGEKLQSDAQGRCQPVAATGEVDEDRHFSTASCRNKEQPHKGQVAAAVTARGATRSVEVSSTSCCVGEKPQQAREAERETGSVLSSSRETRREAADKERENDFKCEQSSGVAQSAVDISDEGDQSRVLEAGAVCEKEGKDSRTLRGEASVRMERRETRCSLLQERQSLLLQERSAAFLNLSYPTVLASILPLQSLAHTIARLILHLHRQLICRFIAAHATILLDSQRGHGKPSLTPALLQHLVRQLVEADAGCADCNSSSGSAKSGGNSSSNNNGGSSCRSSRSRSGSGEESQNIGKSLRGVARVCRGHAVPAEQCGGASRPDVPWRGRSVPEAPSAAIEAFAKTAAGSGRLGSDSIEEQSEGLRKRSATTMRTHSGPAAAAAMQKIVEQQSGQGSGTVCDGSGSSRGGRGAGGAATELGRLGSPALYYASLLHSNMGDEVSTSLSSSGTSPSIHILSNATPAGATRSSRADSSNRAEKEREEREGTGSCATYADIVRPAVAAVGAPPEPNAGQQAQLSLSRESGGATAATAAVALQKSAVPAASCVSSVEKAVASLPACAGDAARKTGCLQLSSADILQRVVALSRPPSAGRAGSACGLPSVEETAENVFDCKAADLSQFLIRAHAFYASRGAGEKSAAADSPAFKAEDTQRDDAADSRDKDDRSSLLAFPSSGEARSSNTGSRLY